MARNSAEVNDLVHDLLNPYTVLSDDQHEGLWTKVEAGTYDYKSRIPPDLGTPVSAQSEGLSELTALMKTVLSTPMRPVVTARASGDKIETQLDGHEVFWAHNDIRLDYTGFHRRRLRDHIVRRRFGIEILNVVPFNPPDSEEAEYQSYSDDYWRWEISTPDPAAVGFQERDGNVTLAALEEVINVSDLAKYYKGRKDETPLQLLSRELPNLRASDGKGTLSPANDGWLGAKVKRCVVYDSGYITQYVEEEPGSNKYQPVAEEVKNSFGMPPVIVYPGIYRPHAPISEMYEALIGPAARVEYNLTMAMSILLTVAGNPRWAEELDKDVAQSLISALQTGQITPQLLQGLHMSQPNSDKGAKSGANWAMALGKVTDTTPAIGDATSFASVIQHWRDERQRLWASWQSVSPTLDSIGRNQPAAAIYMALESGQKRSEDTLSVLVAGRQKRAMMIAHDFAYGFKQNITVKPYGNEPTAPSKSLGEQYDISADEMKLYPERLSVTWEIAAESDAQRAAALGLEVEAQQALGIHNPRRLYEAMGIDNVSARLEEDAAVSNAQLLGPGMASLAMRDVLNEIALETDRDPEVLQQMFAPQLQPSGQPGGGGGQEPNTGYRYQGATRPQPFGGGQTANGR